MQKKSDFIKKSPLPQVGIEPTTYGFSERFKPWNIFSLRKYYKIILHIHCVFVNYFVFIGIMLFCFLLSFVLSLILCKKSGIFRRTDQ